MAMHRSDAPAMLLFVSTHIQPTAEYPNGDASF
jgi:hypothetical protein